MQVFFHLTLFRHQNIKSPYVPLPKTVSFEHPVSVLWPLISGQSQNLTFSSFPVDCFPLGSVLLFEFWFQGVSKYHVRIYFHQPNYIIKVAPPFNLASETAEQKYLKLILSQSDIQRRDGDGTEKLPQNFSELHSASRWNTWDTFPLETFGSGGKGARTN